MPSRCGCARYVALKKSTLPGEEKSCLVKEHSHSWIKFHFAWLLEADNGTDSWIHRSQPACKSILSSCKNLNQQMVEGAGNIIQNCWCRNEVSRVSVGGEERNQHKPSLHDRKYIRSGEQQQLISLKNPFLLDGVHTSFLLVEAASNGCQENWMTSQ